MRNRISAAIGVIVPIIVTAIVELTKIIVAIIQSPPDPPKKGERDDT